MSYKQKALSNTAHSSIYTFINIAVNLALTPFYVRSLGLEDYGLMAIVLMFSAFNAASIFDLGLQPIVSRFVAEKKTKNDFAGMSSVLSTALVLLFFVGLLVGVLGISFSKLLIELFNVTPAKKEVFLNALNWVFAAQLFQFMIFGYWGLFEGLQSFLVIRKAQIFNLIGANLISVFLLFRGEGYDSLVKVQLIVTGIQLCYLHLIAIKKNPDLIIRISKFNKNTFLEMWKFSKMLFLGRLSSYAYYQFDRWALSSMLGPSMLAGYDVVMKPAKMLKIFSGLGGNVAIPIASEFQTQEDNAKIERLLRSGIKLLFYLNIPIGFVIAYLAEDFLRVWVGSELVFLASTLQILVFWNIISIPASFGFNVLLGVGKAIKETTLASYIVTFVKIVFILLTLRTYGITSIAWSFVVSSLVLQIYSFYLFKKVLNVSMTGLLIDSAKILLFITPIYFILSVFEKIFKVDNFLALFLVGGVSVVTFWYFLYQFLLSDDEKDSVLILAEKFLRVFKKKK